MTAVHHPTHRIDLISEHPDSTLAQAVSEVSRSNARILVEDQGVPVAAIISADELQRFADLDQASQDPFAVIDRVRAAFADVPDDEIERETDRILADIRANASTLRRDK